MADLWQFRGDTAANWTSANPVLAARELGLETDTQKCKIGDGTTAWASLAYANFGADPVIVANPQTANYTAVAADAGKEVQMNVAGTNTFTVDASLYTPGTYLFVRQVGAGQTTVAAASGTTLTKGGATLKTAQQGSLMYVRIQSSTAAYVGGEVAAS